MKRFYFLVSLLIGLIVAITACGGQTEVIVVATPTPTTPPAPAEVVDAYVEALNAGDIAALAAVYTEDAVFSFGPVSPEGGFETLTGNAAVLSDDLESIANNAQLTFSNVSVEGETVKGEFSYTDDELQEGGVDRLTGTFEIMVEGGRIASIKPAPDTETQQKLAAAFEPAAFEPGTLVGGPRTVSASGTTALWVLPGPRRLAPNVFGTPQQPLGVEPGVGVPLENRLTNEDGTAWTTTKNPTPFGDKATGVTGDFSLTAVDATTVDGDTTDDQVNFTANFTGPDGKEYTIRVDKVLNRGPFHNFLGGVGTNFVHHGRTGIGFKLMPQVFAYVAFWGVAELSIDGQVVANNRFIHAMLTDNVREEGYRLAFDDGVDPTRIQFHIFLPPLEVTPQGPQPSPVPTGFILPNGKEQPFMHINFESVTLDSVGTQR